MQPQTRTQSSVRRLTAQQRRFVRAYVWERKKKSEAFRTASRTKGNARSVSTQVYRLTKIPYVAHTISLAESGDWDTLISCGVAPGALAQKKLLVLADDTSIPPYARVQALRAALRHGTVEPEGAHREHTLEDIEKLLREENAKAGARMAQDWDDLLLDSPPPSWPANHKAQIIGGSRFTQRPQRLAFNILVAPSFRNESRAVSQLSASEFQERLLVVSLSRFFY